MGALPTPLALPLGYPVYCANGVLAQVGAVVRDTAPAHRVAIISDRVVGAHHASAILAQCAGVPVQLFTIPPGEQEKTRARWAELTDALVAWGAGRDTTIIALGGGVVGDLAGFVAATFMRGLPVVQVPTTLLAMVDASVGGKTAVDTPAGKNLVGAFHNPSAVVIDPQVLETLPPAVLRSGLAEMLKHGVIADPSYFEQVLAALPDIVRQGAKAHGLDTLIAGSVHLKAHVVAEDTREGGLRQILNFGHTIAHAIEKVRQYDMLHGEAVAMGMVVEARLAEQIGLAHQGLSRSIRDAVQRAGLPATLPPGIDLAAVVAETHGDKKARGGAARYALPRAIGEMEAAEGRWTVPVPDDVVMTALTESVGAPA
ncbi:3-dehydroquinate synthase [Gemmatimonas sp.]|jgi:3-dehydroquinate synthase|uniref:3-dehydroquinate synthase n=1 Tax=Gemmatimonas sp. TaxID=1962908 RepID=UPI0025C23C7C|nr:3-dehydroquinate synthase [Gemmatimonas sp.]MCA2989492.1 3-dehydroquinate synthase [Gemmatimonas sp.]